MKNRKKRTGNEASAHRKRVVHETEGVAGGAVTGAVLGAVGGPPGIAAGAVVGGIVGAVTAAVVDAEAAARRSHRRALDAEIGISDGEMGAPNLEHPPARVGAYSAASAGVGEGRSMPPAEGPMQPPED